MTTARRVRTYRVTAPVTYPLTGQGRLETIEVRSTAEPQEAKRAGVERLRHAGWEVDGYRATVREVPLVIGAGTPAQRLRTLRDLLGEDPATFAARFLVPATGTHVRRWEAGAALRPFELQTLTYLERAAFGRNGDQ